MHLLVTEYELSEPRQTHTISPDDQKFPLAAITLSYVSSRTGQESAANARFAATRKTDLSITAEYVSV
jgi:hypothetical protein